MDPPFEEPRGVGASLLEHVRQTATALAKLLDAASGVPDHVRGEVRSACETVQGRIDETRLTIGLVGDAGAGRRTLVNALLGDRVLPTGTPRRGSTVTFIRRAESLEFSALSVDGRSVAGLSRKLPERQGLFEKSMAQIDRETATTEALSARLQAARERVESLDRPPEPRAPVPSRRAAEGAWLALWSWILQVLLRWPWVKRLASSAGGDPTGALREPGAAPAPTLDEERATIAAMEVELSTMRTVEQVAAHRQRLRQERQKYEQERRAAFLSQVRDFDGTDIGERVVEYPAKHLPDGLTLMDVPCPHAAGAPAVEKMRSRVARDADAIVVIADVAQPPGDATASLVRALSDHVPVVLVVLTKADRALRAWTEGRGGDVASRIQPMRSQAFERATVALGASVRRAPGVAVAAEAALDGRPESSVLADHFYATISALRACFERQRPVLIAWREALRMQTQMAALSGAQAREEDLSRKRLSGLESNRIPDPAEFRRQLLHRLDGGIEEGAGRVLASGIDGLRSAIQRLRSEWQARISAASARAEVDACIAFIGESAGRRIADVLEQTAEIVARELHDVTDGLQAWAIAEIHTHYRLVRRIGAEALAPVASELTREDLERELLAERPFDGAMEAFEKQRVGLGLGGVAAGAAIGTLIAPGIGTAVGAVLGVFAGLLRGTDSLKQECIAKLDACLNETESHALAQLQEKSSDLSRVIRVALEEAFEEAFGRLNEAITRLMTVERRAIDRERVKLADIGAARVALEECSERVARIVARASTVGCSTGLAVDQGWQLR